MKKNKALHTTSSIVHKGFRGLEKFQVRGKFRLGQEKDTSPLSLTNHAAGR